MAYLAEHSVLQFEKLQIKKQVNTSKLNLVTGTMTVAHASGGQDQFVVGTPTAKMTLREAQTVRLDSTLNGLIIHDIDTPLPLNETSRRSKSELQPGEAVAYVDGLRIPLKGPMNHPESDAWDKWVDAQRLARAAAIKGLEESGLKEPIPGLAQLAEQGHFFDCPPYGKCWEPNAQPGDLPGNSAEPSVRLMTKLLGPLEASPHPCPVRTIRHGGLLWRCPTTYGRPTFRRSSRQNET